MTDHYRFHLARAEACRIAADKATSRQTRALHLQLAGLHLDHAMLLEVDEPLSVTFIPPRRRNAVIAVAVAVSPA